MGDTQSSELEQILDELIKFYDSISEYGIDKNQAIAAIEKLIEQAENRGVESATRYWENKYEGLRLKRFTEEPKPSDIENLMVRERLQERKRVDYELEVLQDLVDENSAFVDEYRYGISAARRELSENTKDLFKELEDKA